MKTRLIRWIEHTLRRLLNEPRLVISTVHLEYTITIEPKDDHWWNYSVLRFNKGSYGNYIQTTGCGPRDRVWREFAGIFYEAEQKYEQPR